MNLVRISWSCARCGAAYISTPPEHGLCDQCLADLESLAEQNILIGGEPGGTKSAVFVVAVDQLAYLGSSPCPICGGPVCADCGKALIPLLPGLDPDEHAGEVSDDGG